jgi:AcrR family transcriptional regulator
MSARPRKASDDEVFAAALRMMAELGPQQITLADIAAEAGLTAGALVQRFGSKRALLLALSEKSAQSTGAMFESLRAADPSPLATLFAFGDCMAQMGGSPEALAHHLMWLQQDLTDPDFRRFTLLQARASRRELQRLIAEAVAQGLMKRTVDPARLARAVEITVGGSLMTWAVYQEGKASSWVRQDLEALLAPQMTARAVRRDQERRPRGSTRPRKKRSAVIRE